MTPGNPEFWQKSQKKLLLIIKIGNDVLGLDGVKELPISNKENIANFRLEYKTRQTH